jgi:hypothetical protein
MGGSLACCRTDAVRIHPDEVFNSHRLDTILVEEKLQSRLEFKVR